MDLENLKQLGAVERHRTLQKITLYTFLIPGQCIDEILNPSKYLP